MQVRGCGGIGVWTTVQCWSRAIDSRMIIHTYFIYFFCIYCLCHGTCSFDLPSIQRRSIANTLNDLTDISGSLSYTRVAAAALSENFITPTALLSTYRVSRLPFRPTREGREQSIKQWWSHSGTEKRAREQGGPSSGRSPARLLRMRPSASPISPASSFPRPPTAAAAAALMNASHQRKQLH